MKTPSQTYYYVGTRGDGDRSRLLVSRSSRVPSNVPHERRLEMVRAEIAESVARTRLLSYFKSSNEAEVRIKNKENVPSSSGAPPESKDKVRAKENPAFPPLDEGVDFSSIYNCHNLPFQEEVCIDEGNTVGVELILKPFSFTNKEAESANPRNEDTADVVQQATFEEKLFALRVDANNNRESKAAGSGKNNCKHVYDLDDDIVYGTDSDGEDFLDDDDDDY